MKDSEYEGDEVREDYDDGERKLLSVATSEEELDQPSERRTGYDLTLLSITVILSIVCSDCAGVRAFTSVNNNIVCR